MQHAGAREAAQPASLSVPVALPDTSCHPLNPHICSRHLLCSIIWSNMEDQLRHPPVVKSGKPAFRTWVNPDDQEDGHHSPDLSPGRRSPTIPELQSAMKKSM